MSHRILIIGQDTLLRGRLQANLAAAGYMIRIADDVPSGLKLHAAHPSDLVILDLNRPSLDGLEALSGLRARRGHERTALILLAETSQAEAQDMAASLGIDSCITKPVDAGMLLDLVNHALRPAQRSASSTWYVEDEPVALFDPEDLMTDVSEPEDPDSVTFR